MDKTPQKDLFWFVYRIVLAVLLVRRHTPDLDQCEVKTISERGGFSQYAKRYKCRHKFSRYFSYPFP